MRSCSIKTDGGGQYCHSCSENVKNIVCSNAEDSTNACSDECESAIYGYELVNYCSDSSVWISLEL
jgi:hypothetical protein